MTKIIERNTTIPARRSEIFSTAEDNQPAVDVVVLQGERELAADNRVLGRFRLENIRPARRGETQIEVTFDLDANGILKVGAKDKDTGAEQSITISEGSNLDKAEVDRMIQEAEANRISDQALREAVDARNELDAAAYQVERRLDELGDAAPEHERARAQLLVEEARTAVKEEASVDRARGLSSELQQVHAALGARAAGSAQPGGAGSGDGAPGGPSSGTPGGTSGDDDVIDADFDRS